MKHPFLFYSIFVNFAYAFDLKLGKDERFIAPRRAFLNRGIGFLAAASALTVANPGTARAAEEEEIEVYFGCGCFWHVQHEFVEA